MDWIAHDHLLDSFVYVNDTTDKSYITNISGGAALHEFIFTYKPHIIVGTETWLSPDINNNEVISAEWNYNIYRKDRPDGYSGVMTISKQINSHEITALQTSWELLWTQVIIGNHNKLYIGTYYRPHAGDQNSIDELNLSLQKLNETTKDAEFG